MSDSIQDRRDHLERRFPHWAPRTLDDFLDRCAEEFGDRPLVLADEVTMTYSDVAELSRRLAAGLVAMGVRPGDRVGMVMANHPEFTPIKFAIARAGAVAVPFNFLYREEELAYVLKQSRCNVLVTMTAFADLDYPAMLDRVAPGWDRGPVTEFPELRGIVQLPTGGTPRDGVRTVAELVTLGDGVLGDGALGDGAEGDVPRGTRTPHELADILYTSGTTGSPKGVMVTHDGVLRTGYASALTRAFEDGRRILFSLPCYHMFGYVEGLLAAMFVGGAIIPRTRFSAADYFAAIERHRATEILCVPTMTVALLEHADRSEYDVSSVFAILSGAAPAPIWLWEKVRTELGITEITTGYGMTECGGAMTMSLPDDDLERHSATVGRIKLAGVAGLADEDGALCGYRTIDPVSGSELQSGEEGELISRGPTHMLGYWDKPAETAETLREDWVHSGDLGRVRHDGYVQITGRSKELYKSGGELVMPKEIEELLTAMPGISQAYAVGVPDDRWGEVGCVWIVPEPGSTVRPDDVLTVCREKLARFKVPKHILLTTSEELPTTPTGKVQKFRLAGRAAEVLGDREHA